MLKRLDISHGYFKEHFVKIQANSGEDVYG
jgi:hypothetical protein